MTSVMKRRFGVQHHHQAQSEEKKATLSPGDQKYRELEKAMLEIKILATSQFSVESWKLQLLSKLE